MIFRIFIYFQNYILFLMRLSRLLNKSVWLEKFDLFGKIIFYNPDSHKRIYQLKCGFSITLI